MDDDTLRLDNQICFALYAASRAVVQAYRPALSELGLTYPQYLVLLVLWEGDELSVKELGSRLMLDSGTLTPLLKRLESQGLVTRHRDPDDERKRRVELTPQGRALERRARKVPGTLLRRFDSDDLSEAVQLRERLRALTAHLRKELP